MHLSKKNYQEKIGMKEEVDAEDWKDDDNEKEKGGREEEKKIEDEGKRE